MKIIERPFFFMIGACFGIILAALAAACSPAQRQAVEAAAPGVVKAACVIIVRLDPKAAPFCATADDLAPYADDLVKQLEAARAVSPSPEATAQTSAPLVAMSLEAPRLTHHTKRACVEWRAVLPAPDAGDGGK